MSRVKRIIPMLLFSILIFCISSIPGNEIPSQVSPYSLIFHFFLYLFYSSTLYYFFRNPYASYIFGVIYAASDEIHQYFVPGRSCDPIDFIVDSAGLAVGIFLVIFCLRMGSCAFLTNLFSES